MYKMVVYGPSDEIFIWWGHAALIMENTRWNYSRVYDWGVFTYPSEDFLTDFLKDEVRYKCEYGYLNLGLYVEEDRDITIYTLNLDRRGKETILAYAENNVLPENCYYDYHEFRDNCSTRIRDIIDMGTAGQFRAAHENAAGRMSRRDHVRRFIWSKPFSDWFLGFLMGQDLDEEITKWEEMFLPVEIARNITDFTYIDESGRERRLVESVQISNSSKNRAPILNKPFETWLFALIPGLAIAAIFIFLGFRSRNFLPVSRFFLGLCQSILGLVLGASGCVLFFGYFIMNNDYIQQNINILFINPLLIIVFPLGIMSAINRPRHFSRKITPAKCLCFIWTYVFFTCCVSMLLWLLPFFHQQNQSVLAIITPVAFSLSVIPEKIREIVVINSKVNPNGIY